MAKRTTRFCALLLTSLLAWTTGLQADERSAAQQDIQKAQQDIAELEKLIKAIQAEKSTAQQALQATEKDIGDLEKNIRSLESEQKKTSKKSGNLN